MMYVCFTEMCLFMIIQHQQFLFCITGNYHQIWRPNYRMRWLVLCIVGGVNEQNSIVKNVHVDDWTAERAIIASSALF